MARPLRPHLERFFQFLSTKNAGDMVAESDILAATGWMRSSIDTHRTKRKLDSFLALEGTGRYRVLCDGGTISKGDVAEAFTQKRAGVLVLTKGARAVGKSGEYSLLDSVGRGAVARVWVVRDSGGSKFAIKVMDPRPDLLDSAVLPNVRKRFARESRLGMRLGHPNLVPYRDVGEMRDHPFLVMDLADESLASRIRGGPVCFRESLKIVTDCARGLQYLLGKGCVHRDVKPANVLRFGDRFVVGDLGIVQWSDMNNAFTAAGTITRTSVQLGSWYYMSPEQRQSPHDVTAVSDIYALGISWYEMLTGRTPDPAEVAAQRLTDPTGEPAVNKLIRDTLLYAPEDRPCANELLSRLADLSLG